MNISDLITTEIDKYEVESRGFKKYGKALFSFTEDKAKEFGNTSIETLLDDPYFLNQKWTGEQGLYPKNKEIILDLFEQRKKRLIHTFLYTGGIGIGKTFVNSDLAYIQIYKLITIPNLHRYYNLADGSTTCHISLSKNKDLAKKVTFQEILPKFTNSSFFKDYFPPHIDPEKLGNNPSRMPKELRFPKNIVIFPGTGQAASGYGYNIFSSCIDEANSMERIEKSKKEPMKQYYDAAEEAEREIRERMKSRFPELSLWKKGKPTGLLSIISQAKYPNSFCERKIRQAEVLGEKSGVYWVRLSRWPAHPAGRYDRENFWFDITNQRIIERVSEGICVLCGKKGKNGFLGLNNNFICSINHYKTKYDTDVFTEKASPIGA